MLNSGLPFYYDHINTMRGSRIPDNVSYDSDAYFFFWRSLYQRLASRFKWEVPDHWEKEIFEFMLYGLGFVGVFDTNKYAKTPNQKYGIIPAPSMVTGVGPQLQPTKIKTANPKFYMPYSEIIYEGAGLIKLTGDYKGILDIVDFYAEELAVLYSTINQSIINTRFAYIVGANSEVAAATLKALFDQRNSGKPLMVFDYEKLKTVQPTKAEAVLDKSDSLNAAGGALFEDVVSGMYTNGMNIPTVNYVYGIGGRDTTVEDLEKVYTDLQKIVEIGKVENPYRYLGLRKGEN